MPGPYTAMGWNIDPAGMTELLVSLRDRYPNQPLMVTENGAAFPDEVAPDGRIHDNERVAYLHDHIAAVLDARDAGVDVRGYFAWSLLDNFEWGWGTTAALASSASTTKPLNAPGKTRHSGTGLSPQGPRCLV